MARLFLIHWDPETAQTWGDELAQRGWIVQVARTDSAETYRDIRDMVPDVVVVDLREKPEVSAQTAQAVRGTRWGREVPFVFIGAEDAAMADMRSTYHNATFLKDADHLDAALAAFADAH